MAMGAQYSKTGSNGVHWQYKWLGNVGTKPFTVLPQRGCSQVTETNKRWKFKETCQMHDSILIEKKKK